MGLRENNEEGWDCGDLWDWLAGFFGLGQEREIERRDCGVF